MPQITLAAVRVNANLTQEALAKKLDVDKKTIINWEKGRTRITTPWLQAFAKECDDFPIDYIFLPIKSTKSRKED